MIQRNRRVIDLDRIEQNMRFIRSRVPESAGVLAVVKADGYGHGAPQTARAALRGGAVMLGVASVAEGASLRAGRIEAPILVLGAVTAADADEGVSMGLIQTVCSPEMVCLCEKAAAESGQVAEVHLKVDTGMSRIGVRTEAERDAVLAALRECPHVRLSGAFTHFSDADDGESGEAFTLEQFERFLRLTEGLPAGAVRHCCNSAAIHRHPEMALDLVRAGISLYGYPPVETEPGLLPCMTWTASVSYVKELPEGAFVSYGRTWRAERPLRAATVNCGYGDGYHRCASGKAHVLIHGRKAPVLGRICMDQMVVDVSNIPETKAGDEAILLGADGGEQITAEDLAAWCGTISYEILLSAGSRVTREYTGTGAREGDSEG